MTFHPTSGKQIRRWGGFLALPLLLSLLAGCSSLGPGNPDRRALRPVPTAPSGHIRADRALVAAFFEANGIHLSISDLENIVPPASPKGRIDRNAIRRIATQNKRLLMVVKTDEEFLWDELGNNLPLLVLLPPDAHYNATLAPLIPVAWDRKKKKIELLDGNNQILTLPEQDFFVRREPLKHAALCLIKPGSFNHFEPTRDQKLLLADFWFDQGNYRRAEAIYTALQEDAAAATSPSAVQGYAPVETPDLDALVGQGNVFVRKGRYKEAIGAFQGALSIDPDNPKILNNLAYSMLNGQGELMTALRHANKAAQLDPDNPLVLETLGTINLRIGDAVAAAKYLEQAWAHALDRPPEVQIAIMDQLIRAWLAADRQDLAWQVAEHRHRNFPEYKIPKDILYNFPSLRQATLPKK